MFKRRPLVRFLREPFDVSVHLKSHNEMVLHDDYEVDNELGLSTADKNDGPGLEMQEMTARRGPVSLLDQPLPPEVDENELELGQAVVVHEFKARSESQLSLKAGEKVQVLSATDEGTPGWVDVMNMSGEYGLCPSNHLGQID